MSDQRFIPLCFDSVGFLKGLKRTTWAPGKIVFVRTKLSVRQTLLVLIHFLAEHPRFLPCILLSLLSPLLPLWLRPILLQEAPWWHEVLAMLTTAPGRKEPNDSTWMTWLRIISAVTGTNASPALPTRQADCYNYMNNWAPTPTVPAYASACSGSSQYSSACSCWGYTEPTGKPIFSCLHHSQATDIVNTFASFLTAPQAPDFSAKATALLSDDFVDTSDSINLLAGIPVRYAQGRKP